MRLLDLTSASSSGFSDVVPRRRVRGRSRSCGFPPAAGAHGAHPPRARPGRSSTPSCDSRPTSSVPFLPAAAARAGRWRFAAAPRAGRPHRRRLLRLRGPGTLVLRSCSPTSRARGSRRPSSWPPSHPLPAASPATRTARTRCSTASAAPSGRSTGGSPT